MRSFSLVVLLAACSSNTPPPVVDAQIETISMTCGSAVTDYCKTNACDQKLADAEKNAALCPASEIACGDFKVILRVESGTSTTYYYQGGELVAVAHPSQPACLGGPTNFNAPKCVTGGKSLPACSANDPLPEGW